MKEAIEFEASVENGVIAIPEEYQAVVGAAAKVKIIVVEEEKAPTGEDIPPINRFFELQGLFEEVENLHWFAEIKNPVNWQRNLIDEWE